MLACTFVSLALQLPLRLQKVLSPPQRPRLRLATPARAQLTSQELARPLSCLKCTLRLLRLFPPSLQLSRAPRLSALHRQPLPRLLPVCLTQPPVQLQAPAPLLPVCGTCASILSLCIVLLIIQITKGLCSPNFRVMMLQCLRALQHPPQPLSGVLGLQGTGVGGCVLPLLTS